MQTSPESTGSIERIGSEACDSFLHCAFQRPQTIGILDAVLSLESIAADRLENSAFGDRSATARRYIRCFRHLTEELSKLTLRQNEKRK
jgi:hypothetical protein